MLFGLLFLSLLPVAFMTESFTELLDDDTEGNGGGGDLYDTGNKIPVGGGETGILTPNSGLGDGDSPEKEQTLLDQLLGTETDSHYGREHLDHFVPDTDERVLTDGDDHVILDTSDDNAEPGEISNFHGTPVVSGDGAVDVIDAGAGDDTIVAGDEAAYLFGNSGDDTIIAGDGALAAFGGQGADTLDATESADSYLDGGSGDDILIGGDGDDQLFGGSHEDDLSGALDATDDDVLSGGAGNDDLKGGLGADVLSGGEGDDVIDHFGHAMEESGAERHDYDWHNDHASDVLDGGDGNDTLIFGASDVATGGEGDDVFWLYPEGDDRAHVAEITDFETGKDFLRISLDPESDNSDLSVAVQTSDNGEDGVVTVGGQVVAILKGAPTASVHDIYVEVRPDVFV
ncbi:calcium-binding protein [Aliiroseovarius sp. F20344]|uniref:calcium-binding protein n=1 Tax=Aliiroseovarius sp. F20344 TaxID=2926414 RepID=UPI001FF51B35|nr:calcium-binding protein [Aliiroseovarius sp. F20344]MCK0141557.1 hypothetical protein [Aliiroseovarius sp. F20344]